MPDIDQQLGRLEAKVEQLEEDTREMKGDLKKILDHISETKGGLKTALLMASAAGAAGAALAKLIPFWKP